MVGQMVCLMMKDYFFVCVKGGRENRVSVQKKEEIFHSTGLNKAIFEYGN